MSTIWDVIRRFFSGVFQALEFVKRIAYKVFVVWLMSTWGTLVAIVGTAIFLTRCLYTVSKFALEYMTASTSSFDLIQPGAATGQPFQNGGISQFLSYLNFGIPLDEVVQIILFLLVTRAVIFGYRAIRKFIPIPTAGA